MECNFQAYEARSPLSILYRGGGNEGETYKDTSPSRRDNVSSQVIPARWQARQCLVVLAHVVRRTILKRRRAIGVVEKKLL